MLQPNKPHFGLSWSTALLLMLISWLIGLEWPFILHIAHALHIL